MKYVYFSGIHIEVHAKSFSIIGFTKKKTAIILITFESVFRNVAY